MRLILVRHGETAANVDRILQGHSQNSLSARGRKQVALLADRLRGENITHVYSSDLLRAQESAMPLASVLGLGVVDRIDLRERCYGVYEGRAVAEYDHDLAQSGLSREQFRPLSGESLEDLRERIKRFLEFLWHRHSGQSVLVVAHTGPNKMITKLLLGKGYSDWLSIAQDNAAVSIFEFAGSFSAVGVASVNPLLLNCTQHLSSMLKLPAIAYE